MSTALVSLGSSGFGNHAEHLHVEAVEINNASAVHKYSITNVHNVQEGKGGTREARLLDQLFQHVSVGALPNSEERCDAPKCHPETRVAIQNEITSWITNRDDSAQPKRIKWLTGPAGTGKTAIMGSVAEECQKAGTLAAAFFFSSFSGSQDRMTKKRFVPTIAFQLHQNSSLDDLSTRILNSMAKEPAVFHMQLREQMEVLVLRPLRDLASAGYSTAPKAIIIDGLDECQTDVFNSDASTRGVTATRGPFSRSATKENVQTEILSALLHAVSDPSFPFRVLIASRPEPWIREFFSDPQARLQSEETFLDDKYDPDADIELFPRSRFAELRRRYNLPASWPHDAVIRTLVEKASGQFIYAVTVARFIETPTNPPQVQLQQILGLRPANSSNPYGDLDVLYSVVLNSSPKPLLAVSWILLSTRNEMGFSCSKHERWFLEEYPGETEYLFSNLSSLVRICGVDESHLFSLYHKSLHDFLDDPDRCGAFKLHVDNAWTSGGCQRLAQFLRDRGPSSPHPDGYEESLYLYEFFDTLYSHKIERAWRSHASSWDLAIEQCDVEWWIRKACECWDQSRNNASYAFIRRMFDLVHLKCPRWRHLSMCNRWTRSVVEWSCREPHRFQKAFPCTIPRAVVRAGIFWAREYIKWKGKRLERA